MVIIMVTVRMWSCNGDDDSTVVRIVIRNSAIGPDLYWRAFGALLLFSYTSVTQNVLQYLNCTTVGDQKYVHSQH